MTCTLSANEHIEVLGGRLRLIVSPEHTFGTDAMLLADFAGAKPNDAACDLGTGCGIIPFYWLREGACRSVTAVDISEQAIDQLRRSLALNDPLPIEPVCADLKALPAELPLGGYTLVTMNPPYTAPGAGILSRDPAARAARHETLCTLTDVTAAAARLLRFGGRLCMCVRPERLAELFAAMREARIEPKRMRLVAKRPDTPPWLVLVEGKSGRNPGLVIQPTLFTHAADGSTSAELERIVGSYREK